MGADCCDGHANVPKLAPSAPVDDGDTFTQHPIHINYAEKSLYTNSNSRSLQTEIEALNALHKQILTVDNPAGIPPPPIPVNGQRSGAVTKLRLSANAQHTSGKYPDAYQLYTVGLQMALTRPMWEPSMIVKEEVAALYANRAQTNMAMRKWPEGLADAKASVECKKGGNAKAWWRGGMCLMEMGRLQEAREWVGKGLEVEGGEKELNDLKKEIDAKLEARAKA